MKTADSEINSLRLDCHIANKFWGLAWSALHIVTLREKGSEALHRIWPLILGAHQKMKYREGLQKLGIPDDEPPAIKAAKYHFLTNEIGGLRMEYIEESPKKVWIRYVGPMWTYPGISILAVPTNIRRTTFSGWHPHNGRLMGCPRLGWVSTKFITEGAPYDEGYFIEYDHDLAPGEELRYETVQHTPECDPSRMPRLDADLWPEARRLKASRNWSGGYVKTTVEQLQAMFGEYSTCYIVTEAMRGLGIQYTRELKHDLGIEGNDIESIVELLVGILKACGQAFALERTAASSFRIIITSFNPFDIESSNSLMEAFFAFPAMAVKLLNGRIAINRHIEGSDKNQYEVWDIADTGRWLW